MGYQAADVVGSDTAQNILPVIDLASSREDLVKSVRTACEWGFFQVINHGTCADLLKRIATESEEFFSLPMEEKNRCTTPAKVAGPVHFGGGSGQDWRYVLKVICAPSPSAAMDLWPLRPVGFRKTLMQYVTEQQVLVRKLLAIISESLDLDTYFIENECADPRVVLGINHYPICPDPSATIGIREHSDPNTITVLLQDHVGGLQVCKEGRWLDVKPLENALVVNAGDHLTVLSNGRYPSCLHRVVNSKTDARTSVAMFFAPAMTTRIKPAPALVDDEHPPRYCEVTYSEFLHSFYKNGGPNNKVSLSQFETGNKSKA